MFEARRCAVGPVPSREYVREGCYDRLVVGRNRFAQTIELRRARVIQHDQANAEKLIDLARVVFVRMQVLGKVGALVALHVQVNAHLRAQGDLLEQHAVVAERVG